MIAAGATSSSDAILACLLLVLGIAVLAAVVFAVRRWAFSRRARTADLPFSLQQLRELRAMSQITDEEFEQLKTQLISTSAAADSRKDGEPQWATRHFDTPAARIKRGEDGRR